MDNRKHQERNRKWKKEPHRSFRTEKICTVFHSETAKFSNKSSSNIGMQKNVSELEVISVYLVLTEGGKKRANRNEQSFRSL